MTIRFGAFHDSQRICVSGSIEGGHYDGYYGDSGRNIPIENKKSNEQTEVLSYTDTVLKSSVSQSITYYLGGPVTQPSTMNQLRQEATVYCRPNISYYNRFTTCNVTECLFDINNDPCETKNIAQQYPRVRKAMISRVFFSKLINLHTFLLKSFC